VQHARYPAPLLQQQVQRRVLLQLRGCTPAVQVGEQQQLVSCFQVAHKP
jgi:hypothetical protein